ncbi:MAG: SDR family NAD(P)-dependent oxidoreductase [Thermoplasmata archaeon]|jgi:3-oxoacyl-[acyl-carrier protein] reductase
MNREGAPGPKVVLVTGGSRGIGRAVALRFAREGYDVAFSFHHNTDAARATALAVEACGRRAFYRPIDSARSEETVGFVAEARDVLGRIDTVVANAGMTGSVGWESASPEEWRTTFETNLEGQYFAVRAAAPELKRARGSVVLVASIAGLTAYPEEVTYAASKAGTISLARSLALALAPETRVNAVAPGWVRTDMTAALYDEPQARAAIVRGIPRGRWGEPEDVAAAALFLASDGARFLTGETLVVDGGNSLSWRIGRLR